MKNKISPFALGIIFTLLALLIYNTITTKGRISDPPLTRREVNEAIVQAMASATPLPPYSERVYQIIQPSLVLIHSKGVGADGAENDSLGSGVIIDENADILTSLHVVANATEIEVFFCGWHAVQRPGYRQPAGE